MNIGYNQKIRFFRSAKKFLNTHSAASMYKHMYKLFITKCWAIWTYFHLTHLLLSIKNKYEYSLSNGATARGGPRPPLRVSSILPGLGWLFSNFYTLALLHLLPLHLPKAAWISLWGAFLQAHWGGFSWINHRRPGVWHVLSISVYSACRISQCHSHHTVGRVLG